MTQPSGKDQLTPKPVNEYQLAGASPWARLRDPAVRAKLRALLTGPEALWLLLILASLVALQLSWAAHQRQRRRTAEYMEKVLRAKQTIETPERTHPGLSVPAPLAVEVPVTSPVFRNDLSAPTLVPDSRLPANHSFSSGFKEELTVPAAAHAPPATVPVVESAPAPSTPPQHVPSGFNPELTAPSTPQALPAPTLPDSWGAAAPLSGSTSGGLGDAPPPLSTESFE